MSTPPAPGTFEELGLPSPLQQAIEARGLAAPTQVQVLVASPENAGRDLLVSSQTGSGKTLAFGFLIAAEIIDDKGKLARQDTPAGLVVAPTRELAVQVTRELSWIFEKTGARVMSVTGGSNARDEMRLLRRGCEILVATPGRLIDHLERRNVDLKKLKVVVLDEADEMLDLGFREDLETILKAAPKERRTHLFSATLPGPILKLASTYQREAKRIAVGGGGKQQHQDIEFLAHLFAPGQREAAVVNVLRRHDASATIVFTKTRAGSADLGAALVKRGFTATVISGDLTQSERTRALSSLREGRARVLVATDVAARGLDLPDVGLVIHADPPMEASGLTHRSGRTGRAGKKGVSVLLASRGDRARAERLVMQAGIKMGWTPLPTAKEIEAADRERLVDSVKESAADLDANETEMVERLLKEVPVRDIVAALVRKLSSAMPAAVEISTVAPPSKNDRFERPAGRLDRHDRARPPFERGDRPARPSSGDRPDRARPSYGATRDRKTEEGYVAFRVNVGRDRNAEPRWLLPLICRRGGVTGKDVGAIEIRDRSTTFSVRKEVAETFEKSALRRDPADPQVKFAKELSREELSKFEDRPRAPRRETGVPPRSATPGERDAESGERTGAPPVKHVKSPYAKSNPSERRKVVKGPEAGKPERRKTAAKTAPRNSDDDAPMRPPRKGHGRPPEGYEP